MARRLDLEGDRKVSDELAPHLDLVDPYLWGEPLLNRNIVEFIRYAEQRRVGTNLSSNLNKLRPGLAAEFVAAGLGHLVVSVSRASGPVCERDHRGGDIEIVLAYGA